MKRKTIFMLLILTAVLAAAVPGVSAIEAYVAPGLALYDSDFSCGTCHVSLGGGGPRTAYGEEFRNVSNHSANPTYALMVIGDPNQSNVTPTPTVTETPEANETVTPTVTETPEANETVTPTVTETPEANETVTVTPTATVTITATPTTTVTVTPETRRVIEIVDNMSGVPLINQSTMDILAEDFINFNPGDPYNITITRVTGGVVEYNATGILTGGPKQTIKVDWTPQTIGAYILRSDAATETETKVVQVINQKVISPIPELSTMILVSAGLLGLFGLARKRKNS